MAEENKKAAEEKEESKAAETNKAEEQTENQKSDSTEETKASESEEKAQKDEGEVKSSGKDESKPEEKEETEAKEEESSEKKEEETKAEEKSDEELDAAPAAEQAIEKAKEKAKKQSEEVREETQEAIKAKEEDRDRNIKAPSAPDPDFDWDEIEKESDPYDSKEREQLEELYNETLTYIDENEVIKGKVVDITKREVVVNVGGKSEGVVSANEFRYNPELSEGDEVDVYVEKQEDRDGQLVISHRTARTHEAWRKVNEAYEEDEVINGHIKCRTKGGLIADVFGIEAFLPGSQIDVKPIRDYDAYVGKEMEFKVVKINKEFKNVVVSHKALIEAELEEQKKEIISKLEKGQVLEGTVKNITSYGVFVDLGGVDGLVHITDLSWGRINHPEEVVQLDEQINVVILDFDDDKKRIALGIKQLTDHPWDKIQEELEVGQKVKGKVVVMADYGAFVEIAPGVEGLLHVSEMSWSQHLRSAQDFLSVGDEVECVILTLDKEDRKMSLGMKQLAPDPWEDIETKYPVGSKHTGKIRNFTNYGVFAEMEEGIDGLIHISDLSWNKKVKHPSEFCNVGEEIEVVVLEVDKENRRLSLGHKQLEENPWDVFETVFVEGTEHEGTVVSVDNNTATISLPYGLEAICPLKHLKKEDGSTAKVEEKLPFIVLEFNKSARKIVVSHLRTYKDDPKTTRDKERAEQKKEAKETSRKVREMNKGQQQATLGDLDALADLKKEMRKGEGDDDSGKESSDSDSEEEDK